MPISILAHYSIRTADLEASRRFYVDVLGLRVGARPDFDFPGLWLYLGQDEGDFGIVHLIGIDPDHPEGLAGYLGEKPAESLTGTGALDHIAYLATGWATTRERCGKMAIDYTARVVPSLGLLQIFLLDPSGVTIELNYPANEAQA
jgi:catechol 2,3-dioxygenase-like lactoylglutathione lyase family enzyme